MAKAKKQDQVGRPSVMAAAGFQERWAGTSRRILARDLSHREAAAVVGIGRVAVGQLLRMVS